MVSPLVKKVSAELGLPAWEVHLVISSYVASFVCSLRSMDAEDQVTHTFLDIIEMSNGTVNLGIAYREPLAKQLLEFSETISFDYPKVTTILTTYRDVIIRNLVSDRSVTIANIGRLRISDDNTIRFWSSCAYNRLDAPIRSAVNPVFRNKFNELLGLAS